MRAYNLAMMMIFINAGMSLVVGLDVFGPAVAQIETDAFSSILNQVLFGTMTVGGFSFSGVLVLAGALVTAAGLSAIASLRGGGSAQTMSAASIMAFIGLFFASILLSYGVFTNIASSFPGLDTFVNVYLLFQTVVFAYALIQMTTGGQKAHV